MAGHVTIPTLSGRDLRQILAIAGITAAKFSAFLERDKGYTSQSLYPKRKLPLSVIDALYLMLGPDVFWSAYHQVHPPQPTSDGT
jgi:hypothetical protein